MPIYNEKQQKLLNLAKEKLKDKKGIFKDNEKVNSFVAARKIIDDAAAKKTPIIKAYIDIHKESENKPSTYIGRMKEEMRKIAVEQEAIKLAIKMCDKDSENDNDKHFFENALEELNSHPAMEAYEKYIKGLEYLAGVTEKVDKEIEDFFVNDLHIKLIRGDKSVYNKWLTMDEPLKTDKDKLNNQYHKMVAPVKARELFAKQSLATNDALSRSLVDSEDITKLKSIFDARNTPGAYCVSQMFLKGYKLEDIVDTKKAPLIRAEIKKEYKKLRDTDTLETQIEYANKMCEGAEAIIKGFNDYIKRNKNELKTEQDLALHAGSIGVISACCHDLFQALEKLTSSKIADYIDVNRFKEVASKIDTLSAGMGTGSTAQIEYDMKFGSDAVTIDDMAAEVSRQIIINEFLKEIQKDEPNLTANLLEPEQMNDANYQLTVLQDFQDITTIIDDDTGERCLDPEVAGEKNIKKYVSMLTTKFVNDKKLSWDKAKIPVTVKTKGIEGLRPKIDAVITRNGKQLVETDMPGKTGDYLRALEKKGLKGSASSNSHEFNDLIMHYNEAMRRLNDTGTSNKDCILGLTKLIETAENYIKAKREQKGYDSKTVPDDAIDAQMLGKTKGGASIFTSRGKDRYQFALDLIERAKTLENKIAEYEREKAENKKAAIETAKELAQKARGYEALEKEILNKTTPSSAPAGQTATPTAETKEATVQPTPETTVQATPQPTPQSAEQTTPQPAVQTTPQPTAKTASQPTPQPEKPKKPTQKELYIEKMNKYLAKDENKMEPHQKAARANLVEWASISLGSKANLYGDPKKIQKYMDKHTNLNVLQIEHLQERKEANEKIQYYHNNRSLDQKKRLICKIDGDKIMLNKAKSVPKQTSANGCWSCVLSDMLAHFGVDLTQKEIRYYRPKFRPESLKKETFENTEAFKIMSRLSFDTQNEIYDVADLIHYTVPNVALHHMEVDPHTPGIGEKFLNKVKDILINHNSPIAVCMKGHYRAIVGVDGDRLIIEDSAKKVDQYTTSVDAFLAECTDKGDRINVDWLQDITFTKDGKCSIVTEQTKLNKLDCKGGVFSDSLYEYDSHVDGNEYFLDSDGMGETVYLPKMAFEKEIGMEFEEEIVNDVSVDNEQNEVQENSVEEKPEVKEEQLYTKREILNDTDLLANDPQMFEFAKAVVKLMNKVKDDGFTAGLTYYSDWSDEMKAKIPMDMLVNDLELGYSKEELSLMNTKELRDVLKDVVNLDTFFYVDETIQERQREMENEQGDMCM